MDRSIVRRGAFWIATALSLAVAGCGGDDATGTGGGGGGTPVATTAVTVNDNTFSPSAIVVAPGATVTWTFRGAVPHNVTFPSTAIADSNNQMTGTFSTAMPTAVGTYAYACTLHAGMSGTVQVQ